MWWNLLYLKLEPIQKILESSGDFDQFSIHRKIPGLEPDRDSAGIYMFKVNYGNTRTMCEICATLTIKILEPPD